LWADCVEGSDILVCRNMVGENPKDIIYVPTDTDTIKEWGSTLNPSYN
jgi:hypothetical protein